MKSLRRGIPGREDSSAKGWRGERGQIMQGGPWWLTRGHGIQGRHLGSELCWTPMSELWWEESQGPLGPMPDHWGSLRGTQGHRWTHPALCGDPSPWLPPSLGTPECAGVDFRGIHQQREFGVLSRQIIPSDPPSQLSTRTGTKKQSTIFIT